MFSPLFNSLRQIRPDFNFLLKRVDFTCCTFKHTLSDKRSRPKEQRMDLLHGWQVHSQAKGIDHCQKTLVK